MLPYSTQLSWHLFGPLTFHAFGLTVVSAILVGGWLVVRRCVAGGIDKDHATKLVGAVVFTGFVVAHLYSVIAYFPERLAKDPLLLFKIFENISSFGGIVGGVLGIWLYWHFNRGALPKRAWATFLDAVSWAFPFSWILGRAACSMAHDHPGSVTSFPLAFSLKTQAAQSFITTQYREAGRLAELPPASELSALGFHDLGFYELLYTALVICPVFLLLDRKKRATGFYALFFVVLYIPARFAFDFLRIADVHYFGLTPGQWAAIAGMPAALWAWTRLSRQPVEQVAKSGKKARGKAKIAA